MKKSNKNKPWYHGTHCEIDYLNKGNTITQNYDLARIFSYKPSIILFCDDGSIKHNGKKDGFIYIIDEEVRDGDVIPHPHTTMPKGEEWLVTRKLKVKKLNFTVLDISEVLTKKNIREQMKRGTCNN